MPSVTSFELFLTAAVVLAVAPGPGMLYVLARSLRGGRREGLASSLGTALGGIGHVVAAASGSRSSSPPPPLAPSSTRARPTSSISASA